jgi:nitroreductase
MSFLNLVKKRFSVRSYLNKPVPKETLLKILETAHFAPSAKNLQPWHFLIIQKKENLSKIHQCYSRDWLKQAPAVIIACGDHNISWKRPLDNKDHCDIDLAIILDHLTLAAAELGLGTCWICMFDAAKCAELFDLPPNLEPIALIPIGYPTVESNDRHLLRKDLAQIIHWENIEQN